MVRRFFTAISEQLSAELTMPLDRSSAHKLQYCRQLYRHELTPSEMPCRFFFPKSIYKIRKIPRFNNEFEFRLVGALKIV